LRPGMNGAADVVQTRLPNAIQIPAKALFTQHGKAVVYVQTSDGYRAREVQVLARNTGDIAINGISAGTKVALSNPEASDR